ncbi:dipeptide/oligopeptide/nickel ABC transporter permease/ATP-binding protein [Microtetraspora fusca]|uniref:dipeptide/oligopeptide/nickel ABC transporter permease/ATP-binding protein n=1 Tax=Microtetraspora fusca TaxID=1997 RepID=UPI000833D43F|nr:dipeptide/oligopeptide/nickel ABC transporter permease/ATP-binding protein [Microtetraspora fusca]
MRALRSPAPLTGLLLVAAVLTLALLGPALWGESAARIDDGAILQGHSPAHPLGTDDLGRDLLARILVATRLSLLLACLATVVGVAIGLPLGVLPAVLPPRGARAAAGTINALVAFPGLLLAMFTAVVSGLGARGAVLGMGIATAPVLARLTQTLAASVANADYVSAARVLGVSRLRIAVRHVLPNIAEPLLLNITLLFGGSLLGLAGLSFLGLGVQPPDYDWGRLLFDGLSRVYVDPEAALGPAVAIGLAAVGFNLLGEGLAKAASRRAVVPRGAATGEALREARSEGVLSVRGLSVAFPGGAVPVRDVHLDVAPGEIVGVVGESGSGKSLTALAIGGLVPYPGEVTGGINLCGQDLSALSPGELRRLRGTSLAMVFQDPMTTLNPALRVGGQLAEVSTTHQKMPRKEALARAVDRLRRVRIARPEERARQHPHTFSGGMRQRAIIAMGLMGTPKLIIADEPTTALDVTVQRDILLLLREAAKEAAVILISHDIAVVSQLCDRVVVMYAGRVVEELTVAELRRARHPYTRALIAATPDLTTDRDKPLATIPGQPPSPFDDPDGCAFAPRCAAATSACRTTRPLLEDGIACLHPQSSD